MSLLLTKFIQSKSAFFCECNKPKIGRAISPASCAAAIFSFTNAKVSRAGRLNAFDRPGESYRDVIIRVARGGATGVTLIATPAKLEANQDSKCLISHCNCWIIRIA